MIIGKIGNDNITLVERNDNVPAMSKVKVKGKVTTLASLARFRPYEDIIINGDKFNL